MIKKIVRVRNVGKFVSCNAAGDVEFRKLTLVYAENGRGKTTLADVLRSLRSGDGSFVVGRQTLGNPGLQEIQIKTDAVMCSFRNGAWDQSLSNIRLFGPEFIHENVYSGEAVAHEHRKNLYRVILGEEGVGLARRVDDLDGKIRECNREITAKKAEVQVHVPTDMLLDAFLALIPVEEVDARITDAESLVTQLGRAAEIATAKQLDPISMTGLPENFATILARTVADVSRDARQKIVGHVKENTNEAASTWLRDGLRYTRAETCPYCGQSTRGLDIVAAYRGFFSASYDELRGAVTTLRTETGKIADEAAMLRIQGTIESNGTRAAFWAGLIPVDLPAINADEFRGPLGSLMEGALAEIREKESAPLETRIPGRGFQTTLDEYEQLVAKVQAYNAAAGRVNEAIAKKQAETQRGDLDAAKRNLTRLKAVKTRHQEPVNTVCAAYKGLLATKATLDGEKTKAKDALDRYDRTITKKWETDLNRLLGRFGAGFRIGRTERSYQGGTPSSTYQIVINEIAVHLGDAKTPRDVPSFKNTLSAGDRSTLGLAFFLAKLAHDPDIADRVVVFDDPFTSQDGARRTCTQQHICRLAAVANQVIVLSHSPGFLRLIWEACSDAEVKTLQLTRVGQNTTITEWDIADETQSTYCRNHGILTLYRDEGRGSPREIAKTIRPLVEGYLRLKFPREFGLREELGGFIGKIRDAGPGDPLAAAQVVADELQDINAFARRYHHEQNPMADTEPVDDSELATFVGRALALVGGF